MTADSGPARPLHAAVAGATGLTGGHLLELLLEHPRFESVTSLVRHRQRPDEPGLSQQIVDFDKLSIDMIPSRTTTFFCCLGTTIKKAGSREKFRRVDFEYVYQLAELCEQRGVNHFLLVSSIGAKADSSVFYSRVKGEIEHAVRERRIERVSILRPSVLIGDRPEFRLGEKLGVAAMKLAQPFLAGRFRKYRAIPARIVARAMVALAVGPGDGHLIYESDEIAELGGG